MYKNIYIERNKNVKTVFLWDDEKGLMEFDFSAFHYAYRKVTKPTKIRSLYGDFVEKVTRWNEAETGIFEGDISDDVRVLTDLYLDSDIPSKGHRVLFFDIETSMVNGIPVIQKANNNITSIAAYYNGTYNLFIVSQNKITINKPNTIISEYATEQEMLEGFLSYYKKIEPTVVSGWNSDGFDIPYLYHRLQNVFDKQTADTLSPIGKLRFSPNRERWFIAGVSSLDYLPMYKKFTYIQRENYRLDTIGEIELGLKKVAYSGSLDDLYNSDINLFAEYNLRDVEILVKLDEKLQLVELVRGICHAGHCSYEDYEYSSRFIEGTILSFLHRKNIVVPNKDPNGHLLLEAIDNGEERQIQGAYVKDPIPGRYEWVYSLDIQSLYPSLMLSLNISPETKVGKVLNWDIEKHLKNQIKTYDLEDLSKKTSVLSREEFDEFMDEGKFSISANGVLFRPPDKKKIGKIL